MASRMMNNKRYCLAGEPTDVFPEVTFGTTGTPTLVTTNDASAGVKAFKQALASSPKYVLSLEDAYVRLRKASGTFYGQVPTASTFHIQAKEVGGSVAVISCASVTAGDTVKIKVPGSNQITYTAVAYNATSAKVDDTFCVGSSTNADKESAYNIAGCINNAANASYGTTNGDGGSTDTPSTLTAYADVADGVVVIKCTVPGMTICSSNATRLSVVTTTIATVNVPIKAYPGLVVKFAVGVTATCPATGDALKMEVTLEKANRSV